MIPYSVYKIIHLVGILMIFMSMGAAIANSLNGNSKVDVWKKPTLFTYSFGLIIALVGGFGLLARIGVPHGQMPKWAVMKIGIWFIVATLLFVVGKKPSYAKSFWPLLIILGTTAAYLAGSKPF